VYFLPQASLRHLHAGGGNRAFGAQDTWGNIGASVGDYYYAMRCLPFPRNLRHTLRRFLRAPLNRNTVRHPWLIPSVFVREVVAWFRAAGRIIRRPSNYIKDAASYGVEEAACPGPVTHGVHPQVLS
jgi:hypothetical protein